MSNRILGMGVGERLFTGHGTAVFVDPISGELRHSALEGSPNNVSLLVDGDMARFVFAADPSEKGVDVLCLPECSGVVGSQKLLFAQTIAAGGRVFAVVPTDSHEFGLSSEGRFLSAEADGRITLSRQDCRNWEKFHTRLDPQELSGSIISHKIDGKMVRFFITDKSDWIQAHQCRGDFFERDILEVLKIHCCPEKIFVDVGANIGNHSVFVSKFCAVSGIVTFEPNPRAISLLRVNLALNACNNVDTSYVGLALGSAGRRLRIVAPPIDNLGGARLVQDDGGDIASLRGDDVLATKPVGLMKIDVEGMEFDVLEGLQKTIERWRPIILIEVWQESRAALAVWCEKSRYRIQASLTYDNYLLVPNTTANR